MKKKKNPATILAPQVQLKASLAAPIVTAPIHSDLFRIFVSHVNNFFIISHNNVYLGAILIILSRYACVFKFGRRVFRVPYR